MVKHYSIGLKPYLRGVHLITEEIVKGLETLPEEGLLNLLLQHTSAGITINENADPDVRHDLNSFFDKIAPENQRFYNHTMEGPDDMPAHIKSMLCGVSLSIPIRNGRLALGTWQGIYLCEFRNNGGQRKILATIIS